MSVHVIVPPSQEPVSLEEAKHHLRVDEDFDDKLIASLIKSARQTVEEILCRSLMKQTLCYRIDIPNKESFSGLDFPTGLSLDIQLPKPPIISIKKVEFIKQGKNVLIPPECYLLIESDDRWCIKLTLGCFQSFLNLAITYEAGYGDSSEIPEAIRLAILTIVTNCYDRGSNISSNKELVLEIKTLLDPYRVMSLC